MKTKTYAVIAAAVTAVLTTFMMTPAQAVTKSYSLFASHPSVMAQPESGRVIGDIGVDVSGNLYLGYGDWNANTGPIDIARVNSSTGATSVALSATPTEAITRYANIDGVLYAPETDPRTSWTAPAGFATNSGGTWHSVRKTPGQHFFDVAKTGTGALVLVGSRSFPDGSEAGAVAYVSKDNGNTWSIGTTDANNPPSGFERYYWASTLNGKVYVQAGSISGAKVKSFDGSRWSTLRVSSFCTGIGTESFKGLIYCGSGGNVFDGKTVTGLGTTTPRNMTDLYKTADFLYAVDRAGVVYRTNGSYTTGKAGKKYPVWTEYSRPATALPDVAWSVAVVNGRTFLGLGNGQVLVSN